MPEVRSKQGDRIKVVWARVDTCRTVTSEVGIQVVEAVSQEAVAVATLTTRTMAVEAVMVTHHMAKLSARMVHLAPVTKVSIRTWVDKVAVAAEWELIAEITWVAAFMEVMAVTTSQVAIDEAEEVDEAVSNHKTAVVI